MNRIAGRTGIVMIIALLLVGGFAFFVVEYCVNSGDWVAHAGSPHVYSPSGKTVTSTVIIDQNDTILLDTRDGTAYCADADIRTSAVHWVGDRSGNINVRTLSQFTEQIAKIQLEEFDLLSGVYTYGDQTAVARLSIDAQLQKAAMDALGDYNGTIAVYNYETGQILCAVSGPSFDPDNVPENIEQEYPTAYYNKFLDFTYTPGSIFKIVTLGAALESQVDMDQWSFTCSGTYDLAGYDITCESSHGYQSLKDAFRNSCNCAFAALSEDLGGDVLADYVEQFGVVDSVTFDGISTVAGNYEQSQDPSDVAWSAVGQYTDQINPCAFLTFVGAIARGGEGVLPYIVEEVSVRDDPIYSAQAVQSTRIMSQETAQTIREFMRNNVQNKYGDENFPGLMVCAKTGTAEVGGEEELAPNAMLAGFVANEEYPLAFIICVEDGGYGNAVCVPIASQILAACKEAMDNA